MWNFKNWTNRNRGQFGGYQRKKEVGSEGVGKVSEGGQKVQSVISAESVMYGMVTISNDPVLYIWKWISKLILKVLLIRMWGGGC